jgi:hypothetical protein
MKIDRKKRIQRSFNESKKRTNRHTDNRYTK